MGNTMGSLFIGVSGLTTSQNALNTTANNLSNVDTPGYVRQSVLQADRNYITNNKLSGISKQQTGLGVTIGDVIHARDIFLDKLYRSETGRASFYSTSYEAVYEVETLFQEMEGDAFQDVLTGETGFWAAFQEFAKDPSDSVRQNLVIQKAGLFASKSQAVYNGTKKYQANLNTQISDRIDQINDLGKTIKALNIDIMKIEAGGVETAMDLRDQRDLALDELASLGDISYKEDINGIVTVKFEGVPFVNNGNVCEIGKQVDKITGFITPYWPQYSDTKNGEYYKVFDVNTQISSGRKNDKGELKALLCARGDRYATYQDIEGVSEADYKYDLGNSILMKAQAEFDQLVHSVVTQINDIFCPNVKLGAAVTGTDANGNAVTLSAGTKVLDAENCSVGADGAIPPQELFVRNGCSRYSKVTGDDGKTYYVYNEEDPTDTSKQYTTGSIHINEKLKESESSLPSYKQKLGSDGKRPVDHELGQKLADLWEKESLSLNPQDTTPCNFGEYYTKLVGELANNGDKFSSTASGLESSALTIENARQQVIGVSSDEELTNMIKYQNAYNAASRYINVVNEMIETLITQMG